MLDHGRLRVQGEAHPEAHAGVVESRAELVLRERSSKQERRVALTLGEHQLAHDFDAVLSVSGLAEHAADEPSVWDVFVAHDENDEEGEERLPASADARLAPASLVPVNGSLYRVRPYLRQQGYLSLAMKPVDPHAEVVQVRVEEAAVALDGLLPRAGAGASGPARLVAAQRRTGSEVVTPATIEDARFSARLALSELFEERDETDVWDLRLDVPGLGALRVGAHLDDVRNKKEVFVYPARTLTRGDVERRFRPYFTVENNLSIRSKPVGAAGRDEAPPAERVPAPPVEKVEPVPQEPPAGPALDRALRKGAIGLIRAAAATGHIRLVPRRPPGPGDRPKIHIVLMHAYGMGGTIRTVLNLAGYLAEHHEVEVLSVFRAREHPGLRFPPGVEVTTLDDRRESVERKGLRGWLYRLLSNGQSVLMHPEDFGFATSSLWTDLMLARRIGSLRSGILITTRPGFNLIAARFAPQGVVTVGQEHNHFNAHRPALAAEIRREYSKLDALAVLTPGDLREYGELLSSAPTRVVRITNAFPPDFEGATAGLESTIVVSAGRLTWGKGYDRMIPAFAPVARRHPDWTLRIYGGGIKRRRLGRLILEHDLYNNVFLMGKSGRIGEELSKGSVFALGSRREGFPMVIIEAMSKGLPVVAFDCPTGPRETVSHGRDGILVPDGDIEAFSNALLELIEDEGKRRRYGAAALEKAQNWSMDAIGAEWDTLFEELVARDAPAGSAGALQR